MDWLLYMQAASDDDGMVANYKMIIGQWAPSYPETTGYIIPTFLEYGRRYGRSDVLAAAIQMAEYKLAVQFPDGGVPFIKNRSGEKSQPVAFDTGQVLFGLMAAYQQAQDDRYLNAAIRAGNWLVDHQTEEGYWPDYHQGKSVGAIDARVSWALLLLFDLKADQRYKDSARVQLNWVLQQQQANGWFTHCSFQVHQPPVTHTIAYTIEGLLESGVIRNDDRYISSAKKAADILLDQLLSSGYLAGAFDQNWRPSAWWSCLTGDAQLAQIWLHLGKLTGNAKYQPAAERALQFDASTQYLDKMPEEIRGGIAGSWPIYGQYMRLKYPNWAANFFVDPLLNLQE